MPWSRAAAALLALSWAPVAWAGACCVGSTASMPARVGECEKVVVALGMSAETASTWTDRDGVRHDASVIENSGLANLGVGVRANRQWQFGLGVPVRLNRFVTSDDARWGGGLGDIRLTALWDPFEEKPRVVRGHSPMPIFTGGVRIPTGRDWTRSAGVLNEKVTGLQQGAVLAGASVERTLDRWPWSVRTNLELGLGPVGPRPVWLTSANVGKYFGTHWTVTGNLSHQMAWAALSPDVHASTQTNAGISVIHGVPKRWRAWLGARTVVPVPGLNKSTSQRTSVTAGAAIVI